MTTGSAYGQPTALLLAEEVWGSTLHAMRSLSDHGAQVLVAVAGEGASIYAASRSCTSARDISSHDPLDFCTTARDWAVSIAGPEATIVVFPLSDRLVDYLNQGRDLFPEQFRLALPDTATTACLLDKRCAMDVAAKAGLHVPPWAPVGEESAHAQGMPGRIALRPARWTEPGPSYFKIAVAPDLSELEDLIASSTSAGVPLVAQQYLDAPDCAVEFGVVWRSQDRNTTAVCTGRKRRQSSPAGGVMVWGEAAFLSEVQEQALKFLDQSGFTGLGGIEFIRTPAGLSFIEFNPRLEAIHFLAAAAGLDMVGIAFAELVTGRCPEFPAGQLSAAAWLGSAWLERIRSDPGYRLSAIRDRLRYARYPRRARAIWTWRDPAPGLRVALRLGHRALLSTIRTAR